MNNIPQINSTVNSTNHVLSSATSSLFGDQGFCAPPSSLICRVEQKLGFSFAVKKRWHVHRDECQDEYIRLKGRHAQKLRNSRGLDHLYIIGPTKLGLWITSGSPNRTFDVMRNKVPSLAMEQRGKEEAVFSCHISDFEKLCRAAGAYPKRELSEIELKMRRESALRLNRMNKTAMIEATSAPG